MIDTESASQHCASLVTQYEYSSIPCEYSCQMFSLNITKYPKVPPSL